MADITSESIKTLREMTGAGMMDCKKALTEASGNMDEAVDWLRKKGLANAAKKAGRVAAEGLVAVATKGNQGAMIELNSETDFVARNDKFQALAKEIVGVVLNGDDAATAKMPGGNSIADEVTKNVGIIGENMVFRRAKKLSVNKGIVASYVHSAVSPGLGKIGILVGLESAAPADKLEALGKQIAMHIAAAKPEALTTADVDPGALTRERSVLKEQAMASGKTAEIAEKMVEGRIRKYYEEVVLMEQIFVVDGKTKMSDVVAAAGKDAGSPIALTGFARFTLGEGIEKEANDFAAEVAKAAGAA